MLNEMDEYLLTRLFTVVAGVEVTYLYSTTILRHLACLIRRNTTFWGDCTMPVICRIVISFPCLPYLQDSTHDNYIIVLLTDMVCI